MVWQQLKDPIHARNLKNVNNLNIETIFVIQERGILKQLDCNNYHYLNKYNVFGLFIETNKYYIKKIVLFFFLSIIWAEAGSISILNKNIFKFWLRHSVDINYSRQFLYSHWLVTKTVRSSISVQ